MILSEKSLFKVLTALTFQFAIGVGLANAACEAEVEWFCKSHDINRKKDPSNSDLYRYSSYGECSKEYSQYPFQLINKGQEHAQSVYETAVNAINGLPGAFGSDAWSKMQKVDLIDHPLVREHYLKLCFAKAVINSPQLFQKSTSGQQSSSNNSSSNQSNKNANQQSANNQSPSSISPNQSNQLTNSSNSDSVNGRNMKPEQAKLVNEAAQAYATKTAAFEESHKGLKRTHNKGDEASRCLKMDGRQITNTCDFRVEYIFCAYNPDQNAFKAAFEMAAAFDCENRKTGMQGLNARRKQAGTFTADAVYVFGCKVPSLPSGVTYERGRGLSGRCSE